MNDQIIINDEIEQPTLIPIKPYNDDRGILVPITDMIDPNIIRRAYFVQNYGRNVIRGLHYHLNEIKMFTIGAGAAKFITCSIPLDIAKRNDYDEILTYIKKNEQNVKTWVISSRCQSLLVVPKHHANGWIGLEDNTTLFSLSNLTYDQIHGDDIRIDPSVVGNEAWDVKAR